MIDFKIGIDPVLLAANNYDYYENGAILLESVAGWEDLPASVRAVYEKANADGDWVSEHSRLQSKPLDFTIHVQDTPGNLRAVRDKLAAIAAHKGMLTLEIRFVEDTDTIVERYAAYYTSGILVKKDENFLAFNIPFKTATPWKQRSINGGAFSSVL